MNPEGMHRREFLGGAVSASIAAAAGRHGGGSVRRIRLGAPIFLRSDDPEQMALEHVRLGYGAAYCPNALLGDLPRVNAIERAFRKHDVVIAEVGRWVNLLDADAAKREANLRKVTEGLALADAVGALCCVDIAGSHSRTHWFGPHPENLSQAFFDQAVTNARSIIDAVKPKRAKFCYEMMGWAIPDSPDSALKLLKAVDRERFGIHLDPCNLVNSPERFYRNSALLNECFDKLGRWIVSCHAKDLAWDVEMNIHFREVRPGAGALDYATYLRRLASLPHDAPLMMEHLPNAEEYDNGCRHITGMGKAIGLRFQ
jgi:sugar phosphate isomerase/epimerase